MTVRLCATMSCISRAMRARSAAAAIRPCWSRSSSRRAARSSSEASSARRWRTLVPRTPAATESADSPTNSRKPPSELAARIAPSSRIAAAARAFLRASWAATVYSAISSATSAAMSTWTSHCAKATAARTRKTGSGCRRRQTSGSASAAVNRITTTGRPPSVSTSGTASRNTATASPTSKPSGWRRASEKARASVRWPGPVSVSVTCALISVSQPCQSPCSVRPRH